jgi:hypothetical protein
MSLHHPGCNYDICKSVSKNISRLISSIVPTTITGAISTTKVVPSLVTTVPTSIPATVSTSKIMPIFIPGCNCDQCRTASKDIPKVISVTNAPVIPFGIVSSSLLSTEPIKSTDVMPKNDFVTDIPSSTFFVGSTYSTTAYESIPSQSSFTAFPVMPTVFSTFSPSPPNQAIIIKNNEDNNCQISIIALKSQIYKFRK